MSDQPQTTDQTITTDLTVLSADKELLTKYAAYTVAHSDKVMAYVHQDVMTQVERRMTEYVPTAIESAEAARQAIEDKRANHRNLNRMLTLIFALLIGLVVTFVLTHGYLGHLGVTLAPYAFVITVLLDSSLAAYSFIKHY